MKISERKLQNNTVNSAVSITINRVIIELIFGNKCSLSIMALNNVIYLLFIALFMVFCE